MPEDNEKEDTDDSLGVSEDEEMELDAVDELDELDEQDEVEVVDVPKGGAIKEYLSRAGRHREAVKRMEGGAIKE